MPADQMPGNAHDDAVSRNRAAHPRRVVGRPVTGWHVTRRLLAVTAAIVVTATAVLVVVLTAR